MMMMMMLWTFCLHNTMPGGSYFFRRNFLFSVGTMPVDKSIFFSRHYYCQLEYESDSLHFFHWLWSRWVSHLRSILFLFIRHPKTSTTVTSFRTILPFAFLFQVTSQNFFLLSHFLEHFLSLCLSAQNIKQQQLTIKPDNPSFRQIGSRLVIIIIP